MEDFYLRRSSIEADYISQRFIIVPQYVCVCEREKSCKVIHSSFPTGQKQPTNTHEHLGCIFSGKVPVPGPMTGSWY